MIKTHLAILILFLIFNLTKELDYFSFAKVITPLRNQNDTIDNNKTEDIQINNSTQTSNSSNTIATDSNENDKTRNFLKKRKNDTLKANNIIDFRI